MVTKLSSTEFENVWNSMVNCNEFNPEYRETHFGVGMGFYHEQIEKNKPNGWKKLREIINDIERNCVVYYYCQEDNRNIGKVIYFIVFGEAARTETLKISVQLEKMVGHYFRYEGHPEELIKQIKSGGTGNISDTSPAQCPLF